MPRQTYVNLYRINYLEEDLNLVDPHSAFIVSNIDTITSKRIDVLRPSTAYQIWLEAYLRNGKVVKSSNVLAIKTKDGPVQGMFKLFFRSEKGLNLKVSFCLSAMIVFCSVQR